MGEVPLYSRGVVFTGGLDAISKDAAISCGSFPQKGEVL